MRLIVGFFIFFSFHVQAFPAKEVRPFEIFENFAIAEAKPSSGFIIDEEANRFAQYVGPNGEIRKLRVQVSPGTSNADIAVTFQFEVPGKIYPLSKTVVKCVECTIYSHDLDVLASSSEWNWFNDSPPVWEELKPDQKGMLKKDLDSRSHCTRYLALSAATDPLGFSAPSQDVFACTINDSTFILNTPSRYDECNEDHCVFDFFLEYLEGSRTPRLSSAYNTLVQAFIPVYNLRTRKTQVRHYEHISKFRENDGYRSHYDITTFSSLKAELAVEFVRTVETGTMLAAVTVDRKLGWVVKDRSQENDTEHFSKLTYTMQPINLQVGEVPDYVYFNTTADMGGYPHDAPFKRTRDPNILVPSRYSSNSEMKYELFPKLLFLRSSMPSAEDLPGKDFIHIVNTETKQVTATVDQEEYAIFSLLPKTLERQDQFEMFAKILSSDEEILFSDLRTGAIIASGNIRACGKERSREYGRATYKLNAATRELIWSGYVDGRSCDVRLPLKY